jgi:ClpP class serine protease
MFKDRIPLYKEIESLRNSKLLVYITGDRQGMETQMGSDVLDRLVGHLDSMGNPNKITLLLHSRGGTTSVGWSIANLIRSFCKEFEVIVPMRAHSAATLLCLGADKIIMTKQATLGPIDPSVNSPLNPPIEGQPPQVRYPVSVESIKGFVQLAKKEFGVKDSKGMTEILNSLTQKIHPIVLGDVFRALMQIQMLAKNLLEKHFNGKKDVKDKIEKIVKFLCSESGSHDYTINRTEAKNLGLNIETPDENLYNKIVKVYENIENELELKSAFNPAVILSESETKEYIARRALIESLTNGIDVFVSKGILKRQIINTPTGPMTAFQDNRTFEEWSKENE